MKKIILSIVTFVYLLFSTGIAMNLHYCMGKKIGIDFLSHAKSKCANCGMIEKKDGCCKDEIKFIKLQDSHKNTTNGVQFYSLSEFILPQCFFLKNCNIKSNNRLVVSLNDPPVIYSPPIYIRNCVYRI